MSNYIADAIRVGVTMGSEHLHRLEREKLHAIISDYELVIKDLKERVNGKDKDIVDIVNSIDSSINELVADISGASATAAKSVIANIYKNLADSGYRGVDIDVSSSHNTNLETSFQHMLAATRSILEQKGVFEQYASQCKSFSEEINKQAERFRKVNVSISDALTRLENGLSLIEEPVKED